MRFVFVACLLAPLVACESSSSSDAPEPSLGSCCPADTPVCSIPRDDAGRCMDCCHGSVCGFSPDPDGTCRGPTLDDAGPPCASTAECAAGLVCGFAMADTCTAVGRCVAPIDGGSCDPPAGLCGCDGLAKTCVALGFASGPVLPIGACAADAGAD